LKCWRGLEGAHGFGISQGRDVRRKTISIAGNPLTLTLGRDRTPAQVDEPRTSLRRHLAVLGINAGSSRRAHVLGDDLHALHAAAAHPVD
jgi:hypothetical protein